MKTKSLLYLSLFSIVTFCACKPSHTPQTEKKETEITQQTPLNEDNQATEEEVVEEESMETFSDSLVQSIENKNVTIANSDDKCLRIYSWDTGQGGTMIQWGNLIQYRSGKEIKTIHQSLDMLLHPNGEHDEIDYGSYIDTIYTYPCSDGSKLYLVDNYFRMSGNYSENSLVAMRIKDGKLISAPCFVRHGKRMDTVGLEHTVADWYFLANMGEGWKWLFQYDKKTQNLYVATTDNMDNITDRYDIYHFNGTEFVYQKTDAPFWLHPELRNYQRLELFFRTKDYIVRIDNLDGKTMRYASWKSTQQMSDAPEMILTGSFIEEDNTFLFLKGSYRYIITMDNTVTLNVQQNGKIILQQTQETKIP